MRTRTLLFALVLLASGRASAHHSFAMYDPAQLIHITGTVKSFQWTNPHVMVWVVKDEPAGEVWTIELPTSPGNLARIGWSKHSLAPGEKVDVEVSPLRDGQHAGSFKKATKLASGEVLLATVSGGDAKDAGAGAPSAPPVSAPSCDDPPAPAQSAAPAPAPAVLADKASTGGGAVTEEHAGLCALVAPGRAGAGETLFLLGLAVVARLWRARRRAWRSLCVAALLSSVSAGAQADAAPAARAKTALKPAAKVAEKSAINAPPRPKDWAALAKLPDWSGVWNPNISDQNAQIKTNPTPWKPDVQPQIEALQADEKNGRPKGLFVDCLPEAMPSWMLITHNALEILFTPGRVTILGESDGNRLRRIYTDGRPHPEDPDPTFHGHSVGHWEGDTLVVDTIGIVPQAYLAVSESVGLPNNGDLHVVERWHLGEPDILYDEIEISAPHVLSRPWKTTRKYFRQRARKYDLTEGVCLQGYFSERKDAHGNAIFVPIPQTEGGNPVPPEK